MIGDRQNLPRPLALHMATQALALTSSMHALPLLRNGSLDWNPSLATAAESLAEAIAKTRPEAFAEAVFAEALRRFAAFLDGVQRYQGFEPAPRPAEPPTVLQAGAMRLLDYGAGTPGADGPPVLVVPSLVNRGYVLDLTEDRSLLRHLAARGLRPLLVDWGAPGAAERAYGLADYITGPLQDAFDFAAACGAGKPALLGYCMGGNLALALAGRNRERTAALALLATPWDFQAGQAANLAMLRMTAPALDAVIQHQGVLPTDMLQAMFIGLNPSGPGTKFRMFAEMAPGSARERSFVALEDWLNDGVPLAGPVARECLFEWYLENTPMRGEWRIDGEAVDPAALALPALVIVPRADYIVPPESAKPLATLIPGAELMVVDAGHIGMVTGGGAPKTLYGPLGDWLAGTLT